MRKTSEHQVGRKSMMVRYLSQSTVPSWRCNEDFCEGQSLKLGQ